MNKVLGIFLIMLIGSVSVFAQDRGNGRRGQRDMDPAKHWEKTVEDLKLDEAQAAEFKKINDEFAQKMKANMEANKEDREAMKAKWEEQRGKMLAMQNERNEELKKVLSDEQYQKFLEKQKPRQGGGRHSKSKPKWDKKTK